MKHTFLILMLFFSAYTAVEAQADICQNLYVWEFADENKQRSPITKMLTNEVEDALTITACVILQRRNYARLLEQVDSETAIQSLENVSTSINEELELIKAEAVLFGQVSQDFSGNLFVRVSFESLKSKQILRSSSMTLVGEEAHNLSKRKEKVKAFVMSCVGQKMISGEETFFWQQSKALNTVEAYEAYLIKYPDGKYKSAAKEILADEAAWQEIMSLKNEGKQLRYLKKYITSNRKQHIEEAKIVLGNLLWKKKRVAEYLQLFPEGEYATDETIWKHGDIPLYLHYFPNGEYVDQAENALWKSILKASEQATSFDLHKNIDAYMAHFPNGAHYYQIENLLFSKVSKAGDIRFDDAVENYFKYFSTGKLGQKMEELLWSKLASVDNDHPFAEKEKQRISERYLKYFPSGKYAASAKRILGS